MKFSIALTENAIKPDEISAFEPKATSCIRKLYEEKEKEHNCLGWLDLPSLFNKSLFDNIKQSANELRMLAETIVVIGVGGSQLGTKAVVEALSNSFSHLLPQKHPRILFAGHNLSDDYMYELIEVLDSTSVACIVVSKSGTTTEVAIALRILKQYVEQRYGKEEAKKRIVAITDSEKGTLKKIADEEGYRAFAIPRNVGGRFSLFTPVSLLPFAIAGFNIDKLAEGAVTMESRTDASVPIQDNPSALYAITRNLLYQKGKKVEILACFNPKLHSLARWWRQLFGESEGKDKKGIFPTTIDCTADLHSIGQYIQDGERMLFESVISVSDSNHTLKMPFIKEDSDRLNYLNGQSLNEINRMAELGSRFAHTDGGVPNIHIEIPKLDEYNLGQLIYFFEKACAISGCLLGVNPFDQPGVEAYKHNMFALLGKPGFEQEGAELRTRLQ